MEKLIIANWKTYLSINEATLLASSLPIMSNLIIAPSIMHLSFLAKNFPDLNFAAQDVSAISDSYGAYTGETPVIMLQDIGIKYAIIGHSERRSNMLDNTNSISTKLQYCLKLGITPIVCIGETLLDRKNKMHLAVISKQLHEIFDNINDYRGLPRRILDAPRNDSLLSDIIIAYEPFWSVGTGVVPTSSEIEEAIAIVRETVNFVDNRLFLVYGGGVDAANAYDLINLDGLDGLLIGKASTNIEQFRSILNIIK